METGQLHGRESRLDTGWGGGGHVKVNKIRHKIQNDCHYFRVEFCSNKCKLIFVEELDFSPIY